MAFLASAGYTLLVPNAQPWQPDVSPGGCRGQWVRQRGPSGGEPLAPVSRVVDSSI